ncbi:hypothetical protein B8W90_12190, partial [Staphylococcus hominis]
MDMNFSGNGETSSLIRRPAREPAGSGGSCGRIGLRQGVTAVAPLPEPRGLVHAGGKALGQGLARGERARET